MADLALSFDTPEQQHAAAVRGMWTFLATEVLFFGGMLAAYTVYRLRYAAAFRAGSAHEALVLGSINTAILLTSSFLVAVSTLAFAHGKRALTIAALLAAAGFGAVFLAIKFTEYADKVRDHLVPGRSFASTPPQMQLFFALYFMMTGVHALHLAIGVAVLSVMALRTQRRTLRASQLENAALYWHFVDAVWVLLFPLFYLVR
jgi:cytochrome c oxidase subunit 3